MKRTILFGLVTFLLGIGFAVLVLANPFGWASVDRMRARSPGPAAGAAATSGRTDGRPTERRIKYWRAPMDPTYIRDKPGKSPMGMDLLPVYEDEEEGPAPGTVRIDPGFVQNIGVQSEPVRRTDIPFTVRTVGTLAYDDGRAVWVNTKFDGWIERVYVNYVGEAVRKGQKLFEIYSPQLVTTQNEYLQAVDYAKRMGDSDYPEAAKRARSLVESSRQRLTYWDISDAQIDELQRSRTIRRTLTAVSPADGLVVEKMSQALEGMSVKAGMNLYKIVDLSKIWAEAEIYEHQVPWLKVGQRAVVDVPTDPGRRIVGRVRYIYPFFSEKTRTMKVSIELPNPGNRLRADMYVNITFDVPSAQNVLVVPEEAVIHSGTRKVLVLDRGNGTFQVREVKLGVNGSGLWEVKDGVEEGDRVVVSAQFLIDSESSLKEAIRKLTTADSGDSPSDTLDQPPVDHSKHPAPPTPAPAARHNEQKP
jgi:Cu(I)/Ag(I) efflux system membrane fusion protein/cobalt-zinc-cadmium efflux system membrane fusion protein